MALDCVGVPHKEFCVVLRRHSLVAPGRDSQDEGEEEEGANDGTDDDVGTGDA